MYIILYIYIIYTHIYIYVMMKTMCPHAYHHNGFVATHALGHKMYGYIYICVCMCVCVCIMT